PALDATTGERDLRESIRTGAEGTGAVAGTVPAFPWWMALSVGTGGAMGGSGAAGRFQGKSPQTVSARTRRILHCVRYELLWQSSVPGTPYPIETVNAALEARGVAARDEGGQTWVLRTVPVEVGPVMEGGVQVATELRLQLSDRDEGVRELVTEADAFARELGLVLFDPQLMSPITAKDADRVAAQFQRTARYAGEMLGLPEAIAASFDPPEPQRLSGGVKVILLIVAVVLLGLWSLERSLAPPPVLQ